MVLFAREEYPELIDARAFLGSKLMAEGESEAVGLLTSRRRYGQVDAIAEHSGVTASCIATIGLRNTMRIGDEPTFIPTGTINLLLLVVAQSGGRVFSRSACDGRGSSDGSDDGCGNRRDRDGYRLFVIAHPPAGPALEYAGKHTVLGHVIGRAVYDAVLRGVERLAARLQAVN